MVSIVTVSVAQSCRGFTHFACQLLARRLSAFCMLQCCWAFDGVSTACPMAVMGEVCHAITITQK